MPINPKKITNRKPVAKPGGKVNPKQVVTTSDPWVKPGEMVDTMRNLAGIAPAFETAVNIATSTWGVPISGLMGLTTLAASGGDLDEANRVVEAVQKFLVYQPQTEGGQQLMNAVMYPTTKLDQLGGYAGDWTLDKTGNWVLAGAAHTAVTGGPAAALTKRGLTKATGTGRQRQAVVERGIYKGVRPTVVKKEVFNQIPKYMKNARTAVEQIIKNRKNLKFLDKDGNTVTGRLPRTLYEFDQAISQVKQSIFNEYNKLAQRTADKQISVPGNPIVAELQIVANQKELSVLSPETIKYANRRAQALANQEFTALEAQNMIKILNESLKTYEAEPGIRTKGVALVDKLIADNLRAGLDAAVEQATGGQYQALKRQYGALRMLETDVTKRAIVDGRKNLRGLTDMMGDMASGFQVVQGMFTADPTRMGAGLTVKAVANLTKWLNNPNTHVNAMFKQTERLMQSRGRVAPTAAGIGIGGQAGRIDKESSQQFPDVAGAWRRRRGYQNRPIDQASTMREAWIRRNKRLYGR